MLICPNEVEEAENPGHEELDESMPEPEVAPKGVPRVMRIWVRRAGTIFCKDKFEHCDSTSTNDLTFNHRCHSSVLAVACETRHLAAEQVSAETEWCDRV